MDNYQRVALWIDRFACRMQIHEVTREEAVEIAARIWDEKGLLSNPEHEADQFVLVRQLFPPVPKAPKTPARML